MALEYLKHVFQDTLFNIKLSRNKTFLPEEVFNYAKRNNYKSVSLEVAINDSDEYFTNSSETQSCGIKMTLIDAKKQISVIVDENIISPTQFETVKKTYARLANRYGINLDVNYKSSEKLMSVVEAINRIATVNY